MDIMIAAYLLNINIKDDIAYLSNQLGYEIPFYTNILKENLDIETANLFFNKLTKTKTINNHKVIKISQNKSLPMHFSVLLDNKTSIIFQYFKNKQLLISNYSIWNHKITENNLEDQYIDLIIEQKRMSDDLSSLKEKILVKKFS